MLTIRLQRTGTKNRPTFRIVLAEKEKSASKKFQEVLGHYNPRSKDFGIKDDVRLKYWITQNVELSPTVRNLFVEKKLVEGKKVKAWAPKKKEGEAAVSAPVASAATPVAQTPKLATPSDDGASLAPEGREESPTPETPPVEQPTA